MMRPGSTGRPPTTLPLFTMLLATALATACSSMPAGESRPAAVVRTEQVSGTDVLLIAVSPVNENVVWVSGAGGTWLRSTNGGTTWQAGRVPGADSLQFRDVHAVDANTAYLLSIGSGSDSRIYKTTDAGASWTLQFTNAEPRGFYDCFDFWDARRAVVIGDEFDGSVAMLETADGGATWTRVSRAALPPAQPGEGSFAASGTCVETGQGGRAWIVASNPDYGRVLHTADYGSTWTVDTLPITVRAASGPQSVTFRDANNGMALGGGYAVQPGDVLAAMTNDGGHTWSAVTRPPLATGVWGASWVPGAGAPTVVAVGPAGSVYTRDHGATWLSIDSLNYWSVGFASADAGWAVGTDGRITKLSGF
ncbi:MAG: hypothetical protein WEF86_02140 [Gemmatimonadota bacterium]